MAVNPSVSFGFLQQTDPMMHLLRRVAVAVDHTVGRDDDKRIGPEKKKTGHKNHISYLKDCFLVRLSTFNQVLPFFIMYFRDIPSTCVL